MSYVLKLLELFGIALVVAFATSQGGVTGAFLLIPAQIYVLNTLNPTIATTNFLYNLITPLSAISRYVKERRFLMPLAITLMLSAAVGAAIGAYLRMKYFLSPNAYRVFVDSILLMLGAELLWSSRIARRSLQVKVTPVRVLGISRSGRLSFSFSDRTFNVSLPMVAVITLIAGIIGGIYGIGGAAIVSPILIGIFYLPAYITAGPTLFATIGGSVIGLLAYLSFGVYPNIPVTLSMAFGGILGAYVGASTQRLMPEWIIRITLGAVTILIGMLGLVLTPSFSP